jgi:hypothetical protein
MPRSRNEDVSPADTDPVLGARRERYLTAMRAAGFATDREWSERSGFSNSHINKVLNGKIIDPRGSFYDKACTPWRINPDYLRFGTLPVILPEALDTTDDPYPTRAPLVAAAHSLPDPAGSLIVRDLLAESHHETDPGPLHWGIRYLALLHKYL